VFKRLGFWPRIRFPGGTLYTVINFWPELCWTDRGFDPGFSFRPEPCIPESIFDWNCAEQIGVLSFDPGFSFPPEPCIPESIFDRNCAEQIEVLTPDSFSNPYLIYRNPFQKKTILILSQKNFRKKSTENISKMDSGVCIIGKTSPPPKHFTQTLLGGGRVNTLALAPSVRGGVALGFLPRYPGAGSARRLRGTPLCGLGFERPCPWLRQKLRRPARGSAWRGRRSPLTSSRRSLFLAGTAGRWWLDFRRPE